MLRLSARPHQVPESTLRPGTTALRLDNGREGLLHVPPGEVRGLVVSLHGAGGQAGSGLDLFRGDADALGLVVLAPASAGSTWAALHRGADPDTAAVDAALTEVLGSHAFDPARIAVGGFSDGGTYALSLGLVNGDLFPTVVAFSPGFEVSDRRTGRPAVFVSHGVRDEVLPIARTSRRIVPGLEKDGYDVTYREFDGGHAVPPQYAAEAARLVVGG